MTQRKRFARVNIEISNACNQHCSFCPEVVRETSLMPLKRFSKVIEQVAPLTERVCLHLLGEPLLHPDLERMVSVCAELGVDIFFVTNGTLLRERHHEMLLHPIVKQVNFSLHSFGDCFPSKDPRTYLNRIFEFTLLAFDRRPDLYINYRMWNLDLVDQCQAKNAELLGRIEARFRENFDLSKLERLNVRTYKKVHVLNRLYLHFDTQFVWPSLDLPSSGSQGTCHGLSTHFGVLVDGTVVPCCLDKEGDIPLGSMLERPIAEILETPRAIAMFKGFRERQLVEELCKRCQYIERFTKSCDS